MQTYKHNRSKDHRSVRLESVIVSGIVLSVFVIGSFIVVDLLLNRPTVDTGENTPVTLGAYTPRANETKFKFQTDLYEFEVPGEWKLVENQLRTIDGVAYRFESFQGIAGDQLGRELEIFTDSIPATIPVTKLANTTVNSNNQIIVLRTSEHCRSFTPIPDDAKSRPIVSKWDDFEFTCDIIDYKNSTAAVVEPDFAGIKLEGKDESHTFLLVYYDHGERQSQVVFKEVLESFRILY